MSIDKIFEKINASFEKMEAFQKSHDAAFSRAIYILGRVKRYLGLGIFLFVALFELDGYRYLINSDPDVPEQEAVGILFRYFILPLGVFIGAMATCLYVSLRPFGWFLRHLAKGVAEGILLVVAATGLLGYSAECPAVMTVFIAAGIVFICTMLAEKALLFVKDAGESEMEIRHETDV